MNFTYVFASFSVYGWPTTERFSDMSRLFRFCARSGVSFLFSSLMVSRFVCNSAMIYVGIMLIKCFVFIGL